MNTEIKKAKEILKDSSQKKPDNFGNTLSGWF